MDKYVVVAYHPEDEFQTETVYMVENDCDTDDMDFGPFTSEPFAVRMCDKLNELVDTYSQILANSEKEIHSLLRDQCDFLGACQTSFKRCTVCNHYKEEGLICPVCGV